MTRPRFYARQSPEKSLSRAAYTPEGARRFKRCKCRTGYEPRTGGGARTGNGRPYLGPIKNWFHQTLEIEIAGRINEKKKRKEKKGGNTIKTLFQQIRRLVIAAIFSKYASPIAISGRDKLLLRS